MFCKCGCGEKTNPWDRGPKRGQPRDYLKGHWWRGKKRAVGPDYLINPETGCWLWQHAKVPKGYGQAVRDGRVVVAHRWYYEQAKGPVPAGKYLDHLCRVPACVNPDHLEVVTNAENVRRGKSTPLTPEQVAIIKATPRTYGSGRELAKRFGVSDACISAIRSGQTWAAA